MREIRCLLPTSRRQALVLRTSSGLVERDGHAPLLLKHGVKLVFKLLGNVPELGISDQIGCLAGILADVIKLIGIPKPIIGGVLVLITSQGKDGR